MSWKFVNWLGFSRLKHAIMSRSITWQLTALYTLSILIILSGIVTVLYVTLEHSLYKAKKMLLVNEYNRIQQQVMLNPPATVALLRRNTEKYATENSASKHYYIRMGKTGEENYVETPGIDKLDHTPENNRKFPSPRARYKVSVCDTCTKKTLVLSGWLALPNSFQVIPIQIMLSLAEETEILIDYGQMLVAVSLGGVVLVAVLGWLLARYSMRPLFKVMRTIEATSVKKLDVRLVPTHWPHEFMHLANDLNAMFDRLEDSFKRLAQFAADLAHELRTPINNLKGEAEICLMKAHGEEEYQQVLISSVEEFDRLARMIDSLLLLARVDSPAVHLQQKSLNAEKELQTIFEYYQPVAEEHNISLSLQGHAQVIVDEVLFQRVLHNVCSNALRYTPDGGHITATLHSDEQYAYITITDTGIGIPEESLPYIFDRFYRVDSARAQASGGSGLGLAIVKSIMELHGGKVVINSTLNKGTTITLVFPT
jgi:two-component system heavy metal sensor histidine kinase CusS